MSLIEGIHNIFRGEKVLYFFASDRKWITACFDIEYNKIASQVISGSSVGDHFVKKCFQMVVPVPRVDSQKWNEYFMHLIDENIPKNRRSIQKNESFAKSEVESRKDENQRKNQRSTRSIVKKNLPRLLFIMLDFFKESRNPREVKLFVNQYSIMAATLTAQGQEIEINLESAKFLLFTIRYPSIAYE